MQLATTRWLRWVVRSNLHRSEPFFALSLRDGPPLAPNARLRATCSVHGREGREEERQEHALPYTDGNLGGHVAMCGRWEGGTGV